MAATACNSLTSSTWNAALTLGLSSSNRIAPLAALVLVAEGRGWRGAACRLCYDVLPGDGRNILQGQLLSLLSAVTADREGPHCCTVKLGSVWDAAKTANFLCVMKGQRHRRRKVTSCECANGWSCNHCDSTTSYVKAFLLVVLAALLAVKEPLLTRVRGRTWCFQEG